jgi:periplasmic divalent cation tolerance protein
LPVLILTSTKQDFLARKIAKQLVDSRLAAAVQIREVDSFYRWQAKIHNHNEYTLTIKTIEAHFSKIEELIKREHTYDIPQIVMLDIKDGSADYLRWIEEQVS